MEYPITGLQYPGPVKLNQTKLDTTRLHRNFGIPYQTLDMVFEDALGCILNLNQTPPDFAEILDFPLLNT